MTRDELSKIEDEVRKCRKCPLHQDRINAVPGEGSGEPIIMLVGEAPGRNEDIQGRPFVGRAGEYLTYLISLLGMERDDVYITNVVKCRPPNNRDPIDTEIEKCLPYLKRQIKLLKPRIIVALGRYAAKTLASESGVSFKGITRERGRIIKRKIYGLDIYLVYTYHPAAALYNPNLKSIIEDDFKQVDKLLKEISIGGRRSGTLDDFI